jgi:hypothetical protein
VGGVGVGWGTVGFWFVGRGFGAGVRL